jgi:hypothetical protein
MVLSEGTTEKIPNDTTGDRSGDRPTSLNHYATPGSYMYNNISLSSSYKYFRQQLERKSKHILCSITSFFLENRTIYEIIWKNCIEPNRSQMIIKYGACTLHAGYLGLQIHTQVCFSSATMDARTRLSVTFYVHCRFVNSSILVLYKKR